MPPSFELPSGLYEAYQSTDYHLSLRHRDCIIRPDRLSPMPGPLAYVTADNPASQLLSDIVNHRRRQALVDDLRRRKLRHRPGRSVDRDRQWPDELGRWILEANAAEALAIARRFEQRAILFVDVARKVHLMAATPPTEP